MSLDWEKHPINSPKFVHKSSNTISIRKGISPKLYFRVLNELGVCAILAIARMSLAIARHHYASFCQCYTSFGSDRIWPFQSPPFGNSWTKCPKTIQKSNPTKKKDFYFCLKQLAQACPYDLFIQEDDFSLCGHLFPQEGEILHSYIFHRKLKSSPLRRMSSSLNFLPFSQQKRGAW